MLFLACFVMFHLFRRIGSPCMTSATPEYPIMIPGLRSCPREYVPDGDLRTESETGSNHLTSPAAAVLSGSPILKGKEREEKRGRIGTNSFSKHGPKRGLLSMGSCVT